MTTEKSGREQVLAFMQQGNSITQLQALRLFGLWSLAGAIFDLKARGHRIESELFMTAGGARVARYWLADANKTR